MKASDLKNSILQLAISGKLVPQDPEDEPASVLFEKIQVERKKLIKEGKIKAPKASKEIGRINSTTVPFGIPESWMWVRLGDVANLYTGDSIPELVKIAKYNGLEEGYDYIGTKDVSFENKIAYNNGVKIPYKEKGFRYSCENSILLCIEGGSAGRKIGLLDKQVCFGNKLCSITALGFNHLYLYYFLQSDFFRQIFKENNSGIVGGVSIKKFNNLEVPLPPLSEQKRIVDKIQELEPLLIRYDKAAEELARLKVAFPENLRKSILQYAIQGKLVPQNPEDESAEILLSRIQEEKKKLIKEGKLKPSKLPKLNEPINSADMPFQIPNSWAWTTLAEIGMINPRNQIDDNLEVSFIPMDKISEKYKKPVDVSLKKRWKDVKKGYTHLQNGDVIMAKITPCFENQKSTILSGMENCYGAGTTELHVFRKFYNISEKYVLLYLKSSHFMNHAKKNMTGTAGQKRVPTEVFSKYCFPLPPLAEQRRIVNKLDELLDLCDQARQFVDKEI